MEITNVTSTDSAISKAKGLSANASIDAIFANSPDISDNGANGMAFTDVLRRQLGTNGGAIENVEISAEIVSANFTGIAKTPDLNTKIPYAENEEFTADFKETLKSFALRLSENLKELGKDEQTLSAVLQNSLASPIQDDGKTPADLAVNLYNSPNVQLTRELIKRVQNSGENELINALGNGVETLPELDVKQVSRTENLLIAEVAEGFGKFLEAFNKLSQTFSNEDWGNFFEKKPVSEEFIVNLGETDEKKRNIHQDVNGFLQNFAYFFNANLNLEQSAEALVKAESGAVETNVETKAENLAHNEVEANIGTKAENHTADEVEVNVETRAENTEPNIANGVKIQSFAGENTEIQNSNKGIKTFDGDLKTISEALRQTEDLGGITAKTAENSEIFSAKTSEIGLVNEKPEVSLGENYSFGENQLSGKSVLKTAEKFDYQAIETPEKIGVIDENPNALTAKITQATQSQATQNSPNTSFSKVPDTSSGINVLNTKTAEPEKNGTTRPLPNIFDELKAEVIKTPQHPTEKTVFSQEPIEEHKSILQAGALARYSGTHTANGAIGNAQTQQIAGTQTARQNVANSQNPRFIAAEIFENLELADSPDAVNESYEFFKPALPNAKNGSPVLNAEIKGYQKSENSANLQTANAIEQFEKTQSQNSQNFGEELSQDNSGENPKKSDNPQFKANVEVSKPNGEFKIDTKPLDIDEIQKQVVTLNANDFPQNAQKFIQNFQAITPIGQETQDSKTAETPLIKQTFESLEQNIKSGKDEFNIKLNPEGLGEIEVKLTRQNGKTLVTLNATKQETAELLNKQLSALKQAVNSFNTEVKLLEKADTLVKTGLNAAQKSSAIETAIRYQNLNRHDSIAQSRGSEILTPSGVARAETPNQSQNQPNQQNSSSENGNLSENNQRGADKDSRQRHNTFANFNDFEDGEPENEEIFQTQNFVDWYQNRNALRN